MTDQQVIDDRYGLIERIGSGGMADVYVADDRQLNRKVAIKLLHRRFAEDPEFVERFRREASAAAGLQHPNVVAVYDRGEVSDTYYIAMEYLEGRSLKQLIDDEAPLEPERAIDIVIQVLQAARFAHKRGIIHRDLKPHNVIVDDEDRAKVTDFGIARAGASDMTQTGSIMGTAQYLSPEQAQGHEIGAPSDLYSIGIILYELLTGRLPFEADSAVAIALKQVSEDPAPPSSLNPAVSPELEAVVLRALQKDPARRFANADEMILALQHAAQGLALAPAPPVGREPSDRLLPSWWPWAAAAGALLVVALVLVFLLAGGPAQRTVPDVAGAPQADAEIALKNEGFEPDVVRRTSGRPVDTVIGQEPAAGAIVDEGSTVRITVSSGPGSNRVPDVTNLTRTAARQALERAGFVPVFTGEYDNEVPRNRVISTRPDFGFELDRGNEVKVTYSRGPEPTELPDVTGLSLDEARSTLEAAEFEVEVTEVDAPEREPGTVISQAPLGGTEPPHGSTVTLSVARISDEVQVPDLFGRTQADAVAAITDAGLIPRITDGVAPNSASDGRVIAQTPEAGRAIGRGRTVRITVGRLAQSTTPTTPSTP